MSEASTVRPATVTSPQAFRHIGLIVAAHAIDRARKEAKPA
jgi:hypothetical protein